MGRLFRVQFQQPQTRAWPGFFMCQRLQPMSVRAVYEEELKKRGFQSDPAQLRAIEALERCAQEWSAFKAKRSNPIKKLFSKPEIPKGVYMFGGVGRGKSFLMDCFFEAVPIQRKTRLHFHEFMREVHRELAAMQGTVNPLDVLGKKMAQRYRLICFDEFHVADITDAMILHRLLQSLFDNGVGFVTTSNFKPDGLYPDGLHRDRILPAIDLLNARMEVLNVDNGTDYRRRTLEMLDLYKSPLNAETDAAMDTAFTQLASGADEDPLLHIEARQIRAKRRAGGVIWFDFRTCAGGHARKTITSKSPPSSTRSCCQTCRSCRSNWRPRPGASPGWWTCSTTAASS